MRKCTLKGHPNLAKIEDYRIEDDMIYLVIELWNSGSLKGQMKNNKYSEEEALTILHQIVLGLSVLHEELNITHRDLKHDNILCHQIKNEKIYKLSDFGLSSEKDYFSSNLGTIMYLSPEYFDDVSKSKSVDIWALGIILHELLFGTHPFWRN